MPPRVNQQQPAGSTEPTGSVLSRIAPMGFDPRDGISILLYGKSATGKTTLWSTFPRPALALICSGGDRPGELRSIDTPENRKSIRQVVLRAPEEVREVCQAIKEGTLLGPGKVPYQTVVLDHVSGLQDLVLRVILKMEELPAQKGWGLAKKQEWGQCASQCKEIVRDLLSLSCNRVIVAQERNFGAEDEDRPGTEILKPYIGAGVIPSFASWLHPACDYVCQMYLRKKVVFEVSEVGDERVETPVETREVEYCLRTYPSDEYASKFRVPVGHPLPQCIIDPSFPKIVRVIRGQPQTDDPQTLNGK